MVKATHHTESSQKSSKIQKKAITSPTSTDGIEPPLSHQSSDNSHTDTTPPTYSYSPTGKCTKLWPSSLKLSDTHKNTTTPPSTCTSTTPPTSTIFSTGKDTKKEVVYAPQYEM